MDFKKYEITEEEIQLPDYPARVLSDEADEKIKEELYEKDVPEIQELHQKLYAQEKHGLLIILQAMDAAGKDELIEHIFATLLPQGLKITSFQEPTEEEDSHDYLWRMHNAVPARGQIAILNRSYYEDIIAPQVHHSLEDSKLPDEIKKRNDVVSQRYRQLKDYERYMYENGFPVIKFYFNMSPEEQAKRLIERIENPEQNYEFSMSDIDDRKKWDQFQEVFEEMINHTASTYAPWYVLPADNQWLSRKIATQALIQVLEDIGPEYPVFNKEEKKEAEKIAEQLKNSDL